MEPLTIAAAALKALGKAFSLGLAGYKVYKAPELHADEVSAIAAVLSNSSDLMGMLPGGSKTTVQLFARHAAIATSAFAATMDQHWAGNKEMAPGFHERGWLRRTLGSDLRKEREDDIQTRLSRALDRVGKLEHGGVSKMLDLVSTLVDEPTASPWYQALWEAFTNENLASDTPVQLLELGDPGASRGFEHIYRLEYAAALVSPAGAELARATLELKSTQPVRLRELLTRAISTWDREHIFGAIETPGMPNLPLEDIYVEPDGIDEETNRRAPLRTLIHEMLAKDNIVIVRGDFGHGKSLTARTMACAWAKTYLTEQTTSVDLVVPIFMKCGEDFANHQPSFVEVVTRALQRQADKIGLSVGFDEQMLALPPQTQKVVYVVDGLDEVALTSTEVEAFFKNLKDRTTSQHKAIVFSRKGVIPEREKLRGIPVVDVQPFRIEGERPGGQVGEWLEKWNRSSGQAPITIEQLNEKQLLGIVTTPIVLFMAAVTWKDNDGAAVVKAEIYERFFLQIAKGKCEQDGDGHRPVLDASEKLLEALITRGEIERGKPPMEESTARALAMLWLMGRVAWEGQRLAQKNKDLNINDVTKILDDDLEIRNDLHAVETVRVGVLLVLQADRQGGNDRILFGHKSFREFLVARFWAGQLRQIVRPKRRDQAELEKNLLGARLLGEEDETFDFLVQILNGPAWDNDRGNLIEWAQDCFNDERADPDAESWLEDRRPVFREAALAIGSSVKGANGIVAKRPTTLRTMLAWFWLANDRAILVAPGLSAQQAYLMGVDLTGAYLTGANLNGAKLHRADLNGANLSGARLNIANLNGANLTDANLQRAHLYGANLFDADLTGANLEGANLNGANLAGADLEEANVYGADLTGADLNDVLYDDATQWPEGVTIQDGQVIVPKPNDD